MPFKLVDPTPGKTPFFYVRGTHKGVYMDRSTKETQRAKAQAKLKRWRDEIDAGDHVKAGEPSFGDAVVMYLAAHGEERFLGAITDRIGGVALRTVDQQVIDALAIELYPEATNATRNRQVYTPVNAVLRHAGVNLGLRRPKGALGRAKTAWMTPAQAESIVGAAYRLDPEFGLLLEVLLYTGMRLSEALVQFTCEGYEPGAEIATLARTKNDDPRGVFIPPSLAASLAGHPRGLDRKGPVFRFRKNGRLYTLLARAKEASGCGDVTFHQFRHTWATWMRRYGGLDAKGLQGTGAWRDEKSASRYAHVVVSEEARKAMLLPTVNVERTRVKSAKSERKTPKSQ